MSQLRRRSPSSFSSSSYSSSSSHSSGSTSYMMMPWPHSVPQPLPIDVGSPNEQLTSTPVATAHIAPPAPFAATKGTQRSPVLPRNPYASPANSSIDDPWDNTGTTPTQNNTPTRMDRSSGSSTPAPLPPPPYVPTMRHIRLQDDVQYLPFANAPAVTDAGSIDPEDTQRLFFGQLAYDCTPEHLAGLVHAITGCALVQLPEMLTRVRKAPNPADPDVVVPMGCANAVCLAAHAAHIVKIINKRVLFDVEGIWVAYTPHEAKNLRNYCQSLHRPNAERFPGLPTDSVSAIIVDHRRTGDSPTDTPRSASGKKRRASRRGSSNSNYSHQQ